MTGGFGRHSRPYVVNMQSKGEVSSVTRSEGEMGRGIVMAESGVVYTCPDDLPARIPGLMARAGIASEELPPPEFGEGCERGFALRLSRGKGTVEMTGFYFTEDHRFILGFGWGRNPLRWLRDRELSEVVKRLLIREGMIHHEAVAESSP
jgi:hypothetical protein